MTAIVAVSHKGRVYMGGDAACNSGDHVSVMSEPKVWKAAGMVMGVCGHLCVLQFAKYSVQWPRYKGQNPERFMGSQLAPLYRKALKTLRGELLTGGDDDPLDADILLGLGGKLFSMDASGAFCDQGSAWAIGSGGDVANGVLFHTAGEEPEDRITCALEAAEEVCLSVRSPFTILWQD